jgi:energy-coupling factor transporter ATP-binding protein EcfA2
MPRLSSIAVRRFKRLEELILPLQDTNILIGSNNSGKSSVLQAIHFAVSVAQTAQLLGGVNWQQDKYQLSFNPSQLLYSPVADVLTLATGGNLVEDVNKRVEVEFTSDQGQKCTVAVRRGRNRNIAVAIEGRQLGEQLQNIQQPFSVYAPGLAGVPREELFMSPGRVRRIVARGDANLVLRNVLLMLRNQAGDGWNQFTTDLAEVFPNLKLLVSFDSDTDEYINARFTVNDGPELPLDAAGTSILQAAQLLAYVSLFKPSLLILDEPDSHLHPNNQRMLCKTITKLVAQRGFQVVLSTHSRHVLDAMRSTSRITWISKGAIVPPPENEPTNLTALLLDLGALDSVDYFADGEIKYIVATEDDDPEFVKHVLWSSGFNEDETEVISYSGCTKLDSAIVLGRFLKTKAPHIRMIVHRDRDYLAQAEAEAFTQALAAHDIGAFVTDGSDIESYFVNADHLHQCNPAVSLERVRELIEAARTATKEKSIEIIVNLRTQEAFRKRNQGGQAPNHGQIAVAATNEYEANPAQMMRGKMVLGRVKSLIQAEQGANAVVLATSAHLNVQALRNVVAPPPAVATPE